MSSSEHSSEVMSIHRSVTKIYLRVKKPQNKPSSMPVTHMKTKYATTHSVKRIHSPPLPNPSLICPLNISQLSPSTTTALSNSFFTITILLSSSSFFYLFLIVIPTVYRLEASQRLRVMYLFPTRVPRTASFLISNKVFVSLSCPQPIMITTKTFQVETTMLCPETLQKQ